MNRKAFEKFIFSANVEGSGKASSYVRALDLLSEMLKAYPMGFSDCQNIWKVSDKSRIDALYSLVRQETTKGPKSQWSLPDLPLVICTRVIVVQHYEVTWIFWVVSQRFHPKLKEGLSRSMRKSIFARFANP